VAFAGKAVGLRARVTNAIAFQPRQSSTRARFAGTRTSTNARMTHAQIRQHCSIDSTLGRVLQQAMEELHLSARAYDRILKVSRTIADLAGAGAIASNHLLEAIQYRGLDRNLFY
jgi:magnesium chelatase family protein